MSEVTHAYSRRAAEYTELLGSMSAVHPSDLALIDAWARTVEGPVLDAGCGPGHWTAHLVDLGLQVRGIDLVEPFLDHARSAHPGVRFDRGSIDRLADDDAALGGVLSWFSTIHHTPGDIGVPLAEFARVLRPGGTLVLGCFDAPDGADVEPFDHAVVTAYRWSPERIRAEVERAGFEVVETHRRSGAGYRPVAALVARRTSSGSAGVLGAGGRDDR
ncbi:class I SAM-dependent methyltransferase [Cnuibacter sp. UC19_7]|uniref:class I SAM-dependent methyltransferase n=1 Tax=Cnuibacter sp. UC19_7 TaxID=3350166 RepID=UPI00366D6CDD